MIEDKEEKDNVSNEKIIEEYAKVAKKIIEVSQEKKENGDGSNFPF